MRKAPLVLFVLLAAVLTGGTLTGCTSPRGANPGASPGTHPQSAPDNRSCEAKYLGGLTTRQKLGQLLTVGVTGLADAQRAVRDYQVGGIFLGSWTDRSLLRNGQLQQVQQAAGRPVMVSIDEEGGRVTRVSDLIGSAPSARVTARTTTPEEFGAKTRARAQALRQLGVTVDFAPDIDVSSQPDDSVIGDRSFSADPAVVTKYADAFIQAAHASGLGTVLKHFPGHGAGSGDSHTGAVHTPPLDQLQNRDLVPFRNLVSSGSGVMVGHLDVPGLTDPNVPASINPRAMQLLRQGTGYHAPGFDGPIFTDDLSGMAAITQRLSVPQAVEAALLAGADNALWISTDSLGQVLDLLTQDVTSGRLPMDQVNASVLRMAKFKGVLLPC